LPNTERAASLDSLTAPARATTRPREEQLGPADSADSAPSSARTQSSSPTAASSNARRNPGASCGGGRRMLGGALREAPALLRKRPLGARFIGPLKGPV